MSFPGITSSLYTNKKCIMNELIKERIIREASEFFTRYGIKYTSMDFISRFLNISKRTLYKHFLNKHQLLCQCIVADMEREKIVVEKKTRHEEGIEAIAHLVYHVYKRAISISPAFYKDITNYTEAMQIIREDYRTLLHDINDRFLARAEAEGDIVRGCDKEFIFLFFENCLLLLFKDIEIRADTFKHAIFTYLAGICTQQGREKLKNIKN